ncbi:uncharacterized protein cubi_01551 [Cryptosporidium ubiquitum]|uniref:Uncharacterized protein n=1 Tax=Cryptosporidium ubiquitum TaxID=857276 RepID=A0A1J4MD97_9CRYT|nr:uncharacterized protein cubi_01551 [Cryptosporidium ubiquitum]OII72218.1 hypothetical protein cubi_01551 [Cryptosporidium ubiquitum]
MIDPASAFCIGVYFLGVGVVGSVLYIPISLMRAIEYYHLSRDGKNRRNSLLDGDSLLQGYASNTNNGGMSNGNNNCNNHSLHDDNSSLFFERPELLLIHKKKVLRDILNDNNYLNNLVEFDDKSDYSFGLYERLTTYQTLTHNNVSNRSDFGVSRKSQTKNRNSVINGQGGGIGFEFIRDVLSTTTPSDKDENDDQPEIVIDDESAIFSLEYFKHIGIKKEHDNQTNYGLYVCSSTNSTSSIISSYETGCSSNSNFTNVRRRNCISDYQTKERDFSESNLLMYGHQGLKQEKFLLASLNDGNNDKIEKSMIIEEISAVHDILTL